MNVLKFSNILLSVFVWVVLIGLLMLTSNINMLIEFDMLNCSVMNLNIPIMLDIYSILFTIVVITISGCVMFYNGFYMDGEIYYNRFCKLVMLFVLSMIFLILIPNLLGLMVGWDGLGLTSFLLVIYYQDKRSLGSGMLTVLSNRVGDVLFFIAVSLCSTISSWSFVDINFSWYISGLCGLMVVGSMTKSAQMPFSAWLPAAMAAPSPVSALVHSSTLVTAGVFVLIRFSGSISNGWYLFLGFISSITMLMSAISAVFEPDVKKVVALSTLSQLGVMMLAISVGSISVCFFHLVSHALFKALMFLCVGSVIHFSGIQDLRYLGGIIYSSPVIMSWLMVACLSLSGFPFLSGFYSKDLVLEAFLSGGLSLILCVLVMVSTCLTAVYSGMMILSLFSNMNVINFMGSMSANKYVVMPCSILGIGALFGGFFMQLYILDFSNIFSLYNILKLVPFLCVVCGVSFLSCFYFIMSSQNYKRIFNLNSFWSEMLNDMMSKMWFMPPLSSDMFSSQVMSLSGDIKSLVEDGYMEYTFGGDSSWNMTNKLSSLQMYNQLEYLGLMFFKGFVLIISVMFIYIISMI
uniref:NADH-ubiquinone oxidoreductase chain 5 n=1 Tax=Semelidae sp. STW-2017 TaxID=1969324 RepID=A0A1U9XPD2_9BIVA|nr:NADH dehydrogenase subunit 5 [Semelidae sp. STW-2017]